MRFRLSPRSMTLDELLYVSSNFAPRRIFGRQHEWSAMELLRTESTFQ